MVDKVIPNKGSGPFTDEELERSFVDVEEILEKALSFPKKTIYKSITLDVGVSGMTLVYSGSSDITLTTVPGIGQFVVVQAGSGKITVAAADENNTTNGAQRRLAFVETETGVYTGFGPAFLPVVRNDDGSLSLTPKASAAIGAGGGGVSETLLAQIDAMRATFMPTQTTAPSITGLAMVGQTLTGNVGAYTHTPSSYTVQWYRGATAITGATNNTYVPVEADIGSQLYFKVIPANAIIAAASAFSSSPTSAVIAAGIAISRTHHVSNTSVDANVASLSVAVGNVTAGELIVVSVSWDTNAGSNTGVTVSDNASNTYVAGSVGALVDRTPRVQNFWCLSSAANAALSVTVTNVDVSSPLTVQVTTYSAAGGSTWSMTANNEIGSDFVPMPVSSGAVNVAANSVALAHYYHTYGLVGTLTYSGGTLVGTVDNSFLLEDITYVAENNKVFTAGDDGSGGYTRTGIALNVFTRT